MPVKKKNGQIRVCVYFQDLNNACRKEEFSLPITEIMVVATTSHERLTFMDGSSDYNKIRMALAYKEKTPFRTPKRIYCYIVMPFSLKNIGATYQRVMQNIFDDMCYNPILNPQIISSYIYLLLFFTFIHLEKKDVIYIYIGTQGDTL